MTENTYADDIAALFDDLIAKLHRPPVLLDIYTANFGTENLNIGSPITCGSYVFGRRHYCRKRLCPTCSSCRHYHMRNNLISHVSKRRHGSIYSMTLTVPPSSSSLSKALTALISGLKQLRRRNVWTDICGGVWFIDLTYNIAAQQWHPHLHLVVESVSTDTIDFAELKHRWLKLSGGDIYITQLASAPEDIERLSNYHTLPAHLKDGAKGKTFVATPNLTIQYAKAVKGKQLFRPFGSWNGLKLLDRHRPNAQP